MLPVGCHLNHTEINDVESSNYLETNIDNVNTDVRKLKQSESDSHSPSPNNKAGDFHEFQLPITEL